VVVVEGATLAIFVTGTITMLIIGILLNIAGLDLFCWAVFTLAVYAVPFFVGTTAGFYLFQAGSGPSPSVLSLLVSHLRPGNTLSRLRALPLSALSLGCYLRFPRHVPAMMRLSRLPT
jgi:hypothetical protein